MTHGSGLGSAKALQELEELLKALGARILYAKNIAGSKTKDCFYLERNFKSLVDMITVHP